MGPVIFIMPLGEIPDSGGELGHDAQPASGVQEFQDLGDGFCRRMKMFKNFCGSNEIVIFLKYRLIGEIERIVEVNSKTRVAQQVREGRAGTAAEIQAGAAGWQLLNQRLSQPAEKFAVSCIGRIVFVEVILRFFGPG